MRTLAFLALLTALTSPSVPAAEEKIAPHVLTTSQLKAVVPGHSIARSDVTATPTYGPDVEHFRKDGTYLMLGDNFQDPGMYTLEGNMVCIKTESFKRAMCRFLLVDRDGRYWIFRDLSKQWFYQVRISKH